MKKIAKHFALTKCDALLDIGGREGTEPELGTVAGPVRMTQGEELVGEAAKRRRWAAAEEERMRKERMTQWLGRARGKNIVRKGQFRLD